MIDAGRHPNIEILTNSELVSLRGRAGEFTATVRRAPRYVREDLCTGCGVCSDVCPTVVPNEFEVGMGARKAIYSPFAQAVPNTYIIDRDHCLNDDFLVCTKCQKACDRNAIDYDDRGEEVTLSVGSVVVATGFDTYDASALASYGYGLYDNVVTNMELERVLNATGPTGGHILRPSDQKVPKKIAFIQCVGSRGEGGAKGCEYCSSFCCMNAVKDCLLVKQHEADIEELMVFYIDIRAAGKGFEQFYQRSFGLPELKYVRGRPAKIMEDPDTRDPLIHVEDSETGKVNKVRVDLAVLSTGAVPSESNPRLAKALGIDLQTNGFYQINRQDGSPLHTTREGVYVCGCAAGMHDVSDSVAQASGAAAEAAQYAGRLPEEEPVEREMIDTSGPPRVGVFLCHCGINIAGVLDIEKLKERARQIPNVEVVEDNLFLCSNEGQKRLQELIVEHRLNRVVAAACTPRTHEPIFRESCEEVGLNPYLFEMVNVRDQCSWVHSRVPETATAKAADLIRMGVARARHLQPLKPNSIAMDSTSLVIGGGIAGMTAALELDAQGVPVYLVERSARLGGRLGELAAVYPGGQSASEMLTRLIEKVQRSNIKVRTGCRVESVSGFVGNFDVATSEGNLHVGTMIVATGADLYQPQGEYGYGTYGNVITNHELELLWREGKMRPQDVRGKSAVFIQCVGSRDTESGAGCSQYCCPTTIKQAIGMRDVGMNVVVLHRDMRTVGAKAEEQYRRARALGVRFLRYRPERRPEVVGTGPMAVRVEILEPALNRILDVPADWVVLATGMVPQAQSTAELHELLKLPLGSDGFFMERHAKLGPVETTTEGVFLAGSAGGPRDIASSIAQGAAAAAKVAAISSRDTVALDPTTCVVDQAQCRGCGECVEICQFHAPALVSDGNGVQVAEINQALCKGCGTCASWCPTGAISALHFTDNQVNSMLEAMFAG